MKNVNYTEEMVTKLVELYEEHGNDNLELIADKLGKSVRSIRSKLVREGVYVATPKGSSTATASQPSKKELLNQLEQIVGFDVTPLTGATKQGIQALIDYTQSKAS